MKKVLKLLMIFGIILVLSVIALIDFTPKANVDMQGNYDLINVTNINMTSGDINMNVSGIARDIRGIGVIYWENGAIDNGSAS